MEGPQGHLTLLEAEAGEIRDDEDRTAAWHAETLPGSGPLEVSRRGHEVELRGEAARTLAGHHQDLLGMNRDLAGTTAAGQPHLGLLVVTDHGRIEIPETIDLSPLQEADIDAPGLEVVVEDVEDRADAQGAAHQGGVADRYRYALGNRAHRPRLVDEHQVGRMQMSGQIAGQIRQADAYEDDLAVRELARRLTDQELVACVLHRWS